MTWKDPVLTPVAAGNIDAAALNEMACKPNTRRIFFKCADPKTLVHQSQQSVESVFVTAVGRRGKQEHVPVVIGRKPLQQLEALLPSMMRANAAVRFVDDH
jgi:hypothetical protein